MNDTCIVNMEIAIYLQAEHKHVTSLRLGQETAHC